MLKKAAGMAAKASRNSKDMDIPSSPPGESYNPGWERAALLDDIREVFDRHAGEVAIGSSCSLGPIEVLSSHIRRNKHNVDEAGLHVRLATCKPAEAPSRIFHMRKANRLAPDIFRSLERPPRDELDMLTQWDALHERLLRRVIGCVDFDAPTSSRDLGQILDQPFLLGIARQD